MNDNNMNIENKKSNLPIPIILVPVAVLLIVIGLFITFVGRNDNGMDKYIDSSIKNYNSNEPISVEDSNDKYGYIDLSGKKLTKFEYDYASDFHNGYAYVSKNNKYYIIDKNIKTVMKSDYNIEYNSTQDCYIIGKELYNGKLKKVEDEVYDYTRNFIIIKDDNKAVVKDYNGKKIGVIKGVDYIDAEYDSDYAIIKSSDEKYGIASLKTAKIIFDYQENYITSDDNVFLIEKGDDYKTIYIENDKLLIEYDGEAKVDFYDEYNGIYEIDPDEGKDKYYYLKDEKYYDDVNDIYENKKLEKSYDYLKSDNYRVFKKDDSYGIKQGNKVIVEAKYDDIEFPSEEDYIYAKKLGYKLFILKKGDRYEGRTGYIYDLNSNKNLYQYKVDYLDLLSNLSMPYISLTDKVCNLKNKKCVNVKPYILYSNNRYFKVLVEKNDKMYYDYYNKDMKKIYSVESN